MSTSTDTSTVRSRMGASIVVGEDAWIHVGHFTDQPSLGSYQVTLDVAGAAATVYLSDAQALTLYRRLGDAIIAAEAVAR